jgi:hypothetical protein
LPCHPRLISWAISCPSNSLEGKSWIGLLGTQPASTAQT